MYPDDEDVKKVQAAFFDPFEYLWLRHKGGNALKTEFPGALGKVLPGGLPPAGAEYRHENPGRTAAGARHRSCTHRSAVPGTTAPTR